MIDQERAARAFKLISPDFQDNGLLPERSAYDKAGCHGQNVAPTLLWDNVPAETRSFALLMNDIDAPVAGGFHHWVVYNIPAKVRKLEGNTPFEQGTDQYEHPCLLWPLSSSHRSAASLHFSALRPQGRSLAREGTEL